MKTLAPSVLSVGLLASLISIAAAQQSIYTLDVTTGVSAVGEDGGTVTFTYTLTSGNPVPGLGTSFTLDYTWSSFSEEGHKWSGNYYVDSDGRGGITVDFSSFDQQSLLPENNRQAERAFSEYTPGNFNSHNEAFIRLINDGDIDLTGTFSITLGNAPEVEGYQITDEFASFGVTAHSAFSSSDNKEWWRGMWAGLQENWDLSQPTRYSHGGKVTYDYTVFTNGAASFDTATNPDFLRLGTVAAARIVYEPVPVPEPASAALLGGIAATFALRRRRP